MGRTRALAAGALALALVAAGCGSSSEKPASAAKLAPATGAYAPKIDPADFGRPIDNEYFPLKPGTSFHYEGVAEDGKERQTDDMTVTSATKRILGVDCVVVRDVVSLGGKPEERTFDWYTQDKDGNVWYFGEDSFDYKHGRWVRSDGSWTGGVNGAKPGILMPADPRPGDAYRQEYYKGHAEDLARVISEHGTVKVPAGSSDRALVTYEWTPLEPDVAEHKTYAPGLGNVKEEQVKGGKELMQLVSVKR
jgi:hypothetical protein